MYEKRKSLIHEAVSPHAVVCLSGMCVQLNWFHCIWHFISQRHKDIHSLQHVDNYGTSGVTDVKINFCPIPLPHAASYGY